MKIYNKKSVSDDLKKYDYLSKEDDFIEVTEWTNGEGISITINMNTFELTFGQLDAINYLSQALKYESFKENYSDNHELKLSTIELNLNENFSDTNKKENGFVDTVPLDLKSIPTTLANESILIQIYNYVKEKKQVDFENVKKHFNNVPEKKINIIINFLINRNHIIKKNNKLQYN